MSRLDLSNTLFHMTRETKSESALSTLKSILTEAKIRGTGFGVCGENQPSASCFTEAPFSAIKQIITPPSEPLIGHGYRPYGIAIRRKAAIDHGLRPVIYLPKDEREWVPKKEAWRLVEMPSSAGRGYDFMHEREWRVKGDLSLTGIPGLLVFVWETAEAEELAALDYPVKPLVRAVLPMKYLVQYL